MTATPGDYGPHTTRRGQGKRVIKSLPCTIPIIMYKLSCWSPPPMRHGKRRRGNVRRCGGAAPVGFTALARPAPRQRRRASRPIPLACRAGLSRCRRTRRRRRASLFFPPLAGPIEAGFGRWCRQVRLALPRRARGPFAPAGRPPQGLRPVWASPFRPSVAGGQAGRRYRSGRRPSVYAVQFFGPAVRRGGPPAVVAPACGGLHAAPATGGRKLWRHSRRQTAGHVTVVAKRA